MLTHSQQLCFPKSLPVIRSWVERVPWAGRGDKGSHGDRTNSQEPLEGLWGPLTPWEKRQRSPPPHQCLAVGFGGPRGGRRGPKCKRGKTKAQPAEGDMPEAGHPHPKNIHTSASPKSHEIGV